MLVLGRYSGQWVEVRNPDSGQSMMIGVDRIYRDRNGHPVVNLVFDDPPRHFEIDRPGATGGQAPRRLSGATRRRCAANPEARPMADLAHFDAVDPAQLARFRLRCEVEGYHAATCDGCDNVIRMVLAPLEDCDRDVLCHVCGASGPVVRWEWVAPGNEPGLYF
jgi:hypothetical protein